MLFHDELGVKGLLNLSVANLYVEGLTEVKYIVVGIQAGIGDGVSMGTIESLYFPNFQCVGNGIWVVG